MNVTPREDGRFEVGDRIFQTEAEAKAFADGASAATATSEPAAKAGNPKSLPLWLQVVVGLCGAYLMFSCTSGIGSGGKTAASIGTSESGALTLCQYALKRASTNPATAEVPYVENMGKGGEFFFAWGLSTKPVRMQNAFGAMTSGGASCTVDRTSGKVTTLSLDGRSLL